MTPITDLTARLPAPVEPPELTIAAARSLLRILRDAERKMITTCQDESSSQRPDAIAS
jgi:hypothetical protein